MSALPNRPKPFYQGSVARCPPNGVECIADGEQQYNGNRDQENDTDSCQFSGLLCESAEVLRDGLTHLWDDIFKI
jgi:hypothetical protein